MRFIGCVKSEYLPTLHWANLMTYRRIAMALVFLSTTAALPVRAQDAALPNEARAGLEKACRFFRDKVSTEGGYLWRYSADLARREGEAKATATQIWVQPPGTPAVGLAWLEAHRATNDRFYLDGAVAAARALVRGQLESGGWDYSIEFDPAKRKANAYRVDKNANGKKNVSTLDDDTTQAALRFLMNVDQSLQGKDAEIREAAKYALEQLVKVQYPNGAWPQRFSAPPDPAKFPVKKASFPAEWPREYPSRDYRTHYTFNDNSIATTIDTMLHAARLYDEPRYRQAAQRAGDFMILAQLPEPQPGWAQQYDADMHPVWARKFEPPAVTGGESQGVMRSLMKLYAETGEKKYLEPIPRALAYYRKSLLPNGQLARFYELKTNRPLYFTKKYELTYKDDDMPTHYGFKVGSSLDAIAKEHARLVKLTPAELLKKRASERPKVTPALEVQVRAVLKSLDEQCRWLEKGKLRYHGADSPVEQIIECATFVRNVGVLSRYLAALEK
jgi:PelA/Pel-15E family pectate lyase